MKRSPAQLRKIAALTMACVWLAGPLLSVLHASHGHRYCSEHQTFEELGARGEASVKPVSVQGSTGVRQGGTAEVETDAHLACPVLLAHGREALALVGQSPSGWDVSASVAWVWWDARGFTALSILAVAPKLSPPAV